MFVTMSGEGTVLMLKGKECDRENGQGSQGSNPSSFFTNLTRRKSPHSLLSESPLKRWLSTSDLTILGLSTIIGIGIYVMTTRLARDTAGPAFILSVLLASFSAFFSSICYAECSTRVPKYGSAYVYCYMTLGEVWAFIVGWTMILEYALASAVLARTCSEYIDFLFEGMIYKSIIENVVSWDHPFLAEFPDFLALSLALVMVVIVSLSPRWTAIFNLSVSVVNIVVLIVVFVMSLFLVKAENWTHSFTPYGVQGVVKAASSGFVAFIGLDAIAATAGEASSPQSSVSLSIALTLAAGTVLYCGLATVLTLMSSYDKLSELAPLAKIFSQVPGADYFISAGAICALVSGLFTCSLAGPRVIFNMANDRLLFSSLEHASESCQVPIKTSLICGLLTGCLATFLDVNHLIELLSIGTLTAYTMVAISVLISRFQPGVTSVAYGKEAKRERTDQWLTQVSNDEPEIDSADIQSSFETSMFQQAQTSSYKHRDLWKEPNDFSAFYSGFALFLVVMSLTVLGLTLTTSVESLLRGEGQTLLLAAISVLFFIASLTFLLSQPKNSATFPLMVPCFPGLPIITIFLNILLIIELDYWSFARFAVWLVLGMLFYAFYGYRKSSEAVKPSESPTGDFILYEKPGMDHHVNRIQPKRK